MPAEPGVSDPWLFAKLGGKATPFACLSIPDYCYSNTGKTSDGLDWITTTSGNGKYLFTQNDADVANCLVNLHYTQNTRCISVGSSSCQGKVTTSKIQNSKSINPTAGAIGELTGTKQITAAQSRAIQAAVQSLVGTQVSSNYSDDPSDGGGVVGIASGDAGSEDAQLFLDFIGQDQC